jgi:hypothetical protein
VCLAEVPCASACGFNVGTRLFSPNATSDVFPATQGALVVWEDRDPLVHAAMAWDTLVLSQLHTTKALDAPLVKWDHTCMESLDHMTPQLPFRNNVPPGNGVMCGIWAQTASCPVTLITGIASLAYGPTGLLTCTTNPILQADLVDFTTSPHVHAPCARDSLPSITGRGVNGDSTLADVAAAFYLDTVVCIRSVFCIVGLFDGDAMVRQLAMQANLLADTGANICLGNDESLFVDVHNIDPIPVGVATSLKDEMQITYC